MENNNNTEIWKDIQGTHGLYQVSNWGNVKSVRWNKILKTGIAGGQGTRPTGYKQVSLCVGGKVHREYVHRLVALHFLPYDESQYHKLRVNHKDLDKMNNSLDNLEFVSQKENIHHYYNTINTTIKPRYMRPVVALDSNGNIIGEFASITETSKVLKVGVGTVHRHCTHQNKQNRKSRTPYKFVFKDELLNTNE